MVLLSLTVPGKNLVDGFRRHRNEAFDAALGHLSQHERAEVIEALKKVSWALEATSHPGQIEPFGAAEGARPPVRPAEASNASDGAKPASVPKRIRMEWD